MVPPTIWRAYESYLQNFQLAVEEASGQVFFPDRPVVSSFTDSGHGVEFRRCLYLRGLPSRRLSRGKRLDLVIEALEQLERQTEGRNTVWTLHKSTVHLNYIVVSAGAGKLAQSLHFDFDENGQIDHPFFHLQLTDEPIAADECMAAHVDFEMQETDRTECYVTTRIPTCDMTLTSVLYCVAADHLGGTIFNGFAQRVDAMQDRFPPLRFEALKNSVAETSVHFKSIHWFAHMRA